MKKILFVGSEAMPFAATGGLGDVLGSLPTAIKKAAAGDVDVRVVMPLYSQIKDEFRSQMKEEYVYNVRLSWREQYCRIMSLKQEGVIYYFIDNEYYYKRDSLYGNYDDAERYAFFCMSALSMLDKIGYFPDILHAHDWQSALSVIYLKTLFSADPRYASIRSIFTIHNIEYQGKYDFDILGDVFALGGIERPIVEYDNCINLMKGAIVCADIVSTVSPRYAEEIKTPEYAHGLDNILRQNAYKLRGILNGIDYVYYDPENDPCIAKTFSAETLCDKVQNKLALQRELALPQKENTPLISVISRLASHKGIDIICEIIYKVVSENDVQLIILGCGEGIYESFFRELEKTFPDKVRAMIMYDRDLSKRIYAATDIFLMPSKSEPCGLSQMIASRYGAIPVTRETGGLYDSIKGYWLDGDTIKGNGFTFAGYNSAELLDRICAALELYSEKDICERLVKKIMNTDFSWNISAKKYIEMYQSL
ncbi:MAG: glycogen synthase GlgA [Clostridia bacterium]|nr:glycogen synthase GlgA [Clostridia bacterium]